MLLRGFREAGTRFRNVVNQLHHDHCLADASATEQADLPTAHEGLDEIDYFDAGFKHLQFS